MYFNNDEFEMKLYLKILQIYQNKRHDKEAFEISKNKLYIELMNILKRKENKDIIKNAILLILSLFEDLPIDYLDNCGINSKDLKKEEKQSYLSEMKAEFLNGILN